jgi:hypothetical protein
MSRSTRARLFVIVPERDALVYRKAVRLVALALGSSAPSVEKLVLHELARRKAESVAAEYLYFIGWDEASTVPSRRLARIVSPQRGKRQRCARRAENSLHIAAVPVPRDVTRN